MRRALPLALVACTACFSARAPVRYFELRLDEPEPWQGPRLPALEVSDLHTPPHLDHSRVVIRTSAVEFTHSRTSQWAAPPGRMLGEALREHLARTGRFAKVRRVTAPRAPYVLSGTVLALEVVTAGDEQRARIGLHLELRRSEDDELLWEERLEAEEPVPGSDLGEAVTVLGAAFRRLGDRITAALVEQIGAREERADRVGR